MNSLLGKTVKRKVNCLETFCYFLFCLSLWFSHFRILDSFRSSSR
eukprot:UN13584